MGNDIVLVVLGE